MKDRAASGIILRAEADGRLGPGGTIVEATAGNTGIGLALIGVQRGYKVALFVPERFSEEKVAIMRALGAQVTRTPDAEGMLGAIRRANEFVAYRAGAPPADCTERSSPGRSSPPRRTTRATSCEATGAARRPPAGRRHCGGSPRAPAGSARSPRG